MATEKPNIALQNALRDDVAEDGAVKLRSEIRAMFDTLVGAELVEAVVARVQRHALELYRDLYREEPDLGYGGDLKVIKDEIHKELGRWVSRFISDEHRKFIIRCHAQGMPSSAAVWELMVKDKIINRLAQKDALGAEELRKMLIQRLAYLKPGTARWPEKKFGSVWREARDQYRRVVSDVPYTSKVEQVALLAKNADRISRKLDEPLESVHDMQALTTSVTKTMESMRKLSATERGKSESLSGPQLVAVLERLTLALKTPEQQAIGNEAAQLAGILDGLAFALNAPGQQTGGGNEVSQDTRIVEQLRVALSTSEQKVNKAEALPVEGSGNAEKSE